MDIDKTVASKLDAEAMTNKLIEIITGPSQIIGWEEYALLDKHKYSRNLIHPPLVSLNAEELRSTEFVHDMPFHLVLMAWGPGHGTPIHDHAGSECCMRVLSGRLHEELYEVDHTNETAGANIFESRLVTETECTTIRDSIGWHRVLNKNATGEPAFSLHLYYPPIGQYRIVCPESGKKMSIRCCRFYSINGVVMQE